MRRLTLFSAGTAAACLLAFYASPIPPLLLGALSLCALLLAGRLPCNRRVLRLLAAGALFGLLLTTGYALLFEAPARALEGRTIRLEATVINFPTPGDYGVTVPVRGNEAGGRPVSLSLWMDASFSSLQPGDTLSCVVYCQSATGRGGGPLAQLSRARGLFLSGKVYGAVEHSPAQGQSLRFAPIMAAQALDGLLRRLYPPGQANFLIALLLGDTDGLSDSDWGAFRRTGLSHVVSVSGMHVSFLAGMLHLLPGRERRSAAALRIAIIFFFAAMAGNSPGALRAAVFWSFGLLAPFFGRRSDPLTSLAAALLFLLLLRPYSVADLSLQLSFAATLGILLTASPLQAYWLARLRPATGLKRRILSGALGLAAVSLGVNLFTFPLTLFYFGEVSLLAPLWNLLCNWAVMLVFLGAILSLALGTLFLPLGTLLAALVELPLAFFLWMSRSGASLSFAALPFTSVYYRLLLCFLYLLLLLCLLRWHRGERRMLLPLSAGALALCLSLLLTHWSLRQNSLTLTLLDVGQGQSAALLSRGFRALVDCGGSRAAGSIAASYFQSLGYGRLDLLVITHYDADHVNGIPELFSRMEVSVVALPDRAPDDPYRREIEALAAEQNADLWYIETETHIPFGDARLTLYPPLGQTEDNDSGLSLLCARGEWEALITGDMGASTEALLLERYALPDLELFIAGHHGSKYSSSEALLDALRPETVLISAGQNNGYGHPAGETLARLYAREITVYRTDRMGSISILLP